MFAIYNYSLSPHLQHHSDTPGFCFVSCSCFIVYSLYWQHPPDSPSSGLVLDVQMASPSPKPKVYVLELTEQEWKDNQQMGAFAGMKISYTMEGEKYKIEMTVEQYEIYKKNCGKWRSHPSLSATSTCPNSLFLTRSWFVLSGFNAVSVGLSQFLIPHFCPIFECLRCPQRTLATYWSWARKNGRSTKPMPCSPVWRYLTQWITGSMSSDWVMNNMRSTRKTQVRFIPDFVIVDFSTYWHLTFMRVFSWKVLQKHYLYQ